MGRTEVLTEGITRRALVGTGNSREERNGALLMSECRSVLGKRLTPPTLSERRFFRQLTTRTFTQRHDH